MWEQKVRPRMKAGPRLWKVLACTVCRQTMGNPLGPRELSPAQSLGKEPRDNHTAPTLAVSQSISKEVRNCAREPFCGTSRWKISLPFCMPSALGTVPAWPGFSVVYALPCPYTFCHCPSFSKTFLRQPKLKLPENCPCLSWVTTDSSKRDTEDSISLRS